MTTAKSTDGSPATNPEDAANGRADDPLGGAGRVYFRDRDGHFYELVVSAPG
jgi:hypothetical protein